MANELYHRLSAIEKSEQARAQILGILQQHPVQHPILSSELTQQTGISGSGIRAVISECRKEGMPIASGDDGYWWAACAHELQATIEHMEGRMIAIGDVVRGLRTAQSQVLRVDEIDLSEIYAGDGGE